MAGNEVNDRGSGPRPLDGARVPELAQIMAGPTAGMMLADLGADVIEAETLYGGDDSREEIGQLVAEGVLGNGSG